MLRMIKRTSSPCTNVMLNQQINAGIAKIPFFNPRDYAGVGDLCATHKMEIWMTHKFTIILITGILFILPVQP